MKSALLFGLAAAALAVAGLADAKGQHSHHGASHRGGNPAPTGDLGATPSSDLGVGTVGDAVGGTTDGLVAGGKAKGHSKSTALVGDYGLAGQTLRTDGGTGRSPAHNRTSPY